MLVILLDIVITDILPIQGVPMAQQPAKLSINGEHMFQISTLFGNAQLSIINER